MSPPPMAVPQTAFSTALWDVTRATGLVSLVLLTVVMVLGLSGVLRVAREGWPRFVLQALHRNAALLTIVLLALHITVAVADGYAPVGWLDAIVPFRATYRPLWLAFGAVSLDLIIALVVTSLLRSRMGLRTWRAVHWAAYACFPTAVLHGLGTGSDTRARWVLVLTAGCVGAVVAALGSRLVRGWPWRAGVRVTAATTTAVLVIAGGAFTALGPLQPGWARAAGTPQSLLRAQAPASTTGVQAPGPASSGSVFGGSAAGSLTGTISAQRQDRGRLRLTLRGTLSAPYAAVLTVVLTGQDDGRGGVSAEQTSATFGPPDDPGRYAGTVDSLNGDRLHAVVTGQDASRLGLSAQLRIGATGSTFTGTLQVSPA